MHPVNSTSVKRSSVLGFRNFGFKKCRNSFSQEWIPTLKLNIDLQKGHIHEKHYFTHTEFLLNFMIGARHNSGWVVDNWQLMKQGCQLGCVSFPTASHHPRRTVWQLRFVTIHEARNQVTMSTVFLLRIRILLYESSCFAQWNPTDYQVLMFEHKQQYKISYNPQQNVLFTLHEELVFVSFLFLFVKRQKKKETRNWLCTHLSETNLS